MVSKKTKKTKKTKKQLYKKIYPHKGGTLSSAFGSLLYKNLGKNNKTYKPPALQFMQSAFKNITKTTKSTQEFLKIIYNRRQPNEFELSKYANKPISSFLLEREPYIWLRSFDRHLLVMWDTSTFNPNTGKLQPIIHYAIVLKHNNKFGASIISYLPPSPLSGTHIYKIALFKYPDNLLYTVNDSSPTNRNLALINLYKFIKLNKLLRVATRVINVYKTTKTLAQDLIGNIFRK